MDRKAPQDTYLFIIQLALERYNLETDEFYKLTNWPQIYKHPNIVRTAYVALDLWRSEKFIGLPYQYQNEAKLIHVALLNA